MATIAEALRVALDLRRDGRGWEADVLLQRIIDADPGNAPARRLLAIAQCDRGDGDGALRTLAPLTAIPHANDALWFEYARALVTSGRAGEALSALRRAATLAPATHKLWEQLGRTLGNIGDWAGSATAARRATLVAPEDVELERMWLHALGQHGRALLAAGRIAEAIPALLGGSHCLPTIEALYAAGVAALDAEDHGTASTLFRALTLIDPANVGALTNIAGCLIRERDHSGGRVFAERAIRIAPDDAIALAASAHTHFASGEDGEAIALYRKALSLDPELPGARLNLSLSALRAGRLREGWVEYAARWESPDAAPFIRPFTRGPGAIPRWDGRSLEGGTLLVHAEQGLGDTIQLARALTRITRFDPGRVIVEVQAPLVRLIGDALADDERFEVIPRPPDFPAARFDTPIDAQIDTMDLGALFYPTLDAVSVDATYLRADAERVDAWRRRIDTRAAGARLRCGLAWSGNPRNPENRHRRIDAAALAPLLAVPNVAWFSCQVGEPAADRHGFGIPIIDLTDGFHDFTDTAAAMSALDLMITVDTAVANLAGALGIPLWIALHHPPDWRWGVHGDRSPWYPSARLFRQRTAGDWSGPIADMAIALEETTNGPERE